MDAATPPNDRTIDKQQRANDHRSIFVRSLARTFSSTSNEMMDANTMDEVKKSITHHLNRLMIAMFIINFMLGRRSCRID
jgi:Ulp1 family protease